MSVNGVILEVFRLAVIAPAPVELIMLLVAAFSLSFLFLSTFTPHHSKPRWRSSAPRSLPNFLWKSLLPLDVGYPERSGLSLVHFFSPLLSAWQLLHSAWPRMR